MVDEIVVEDTTETPQEELKKTSEGSEQTDYEKLIAEQNAKIAKLEENNSNLTRGINKWKKAAKGDESYEPEPLDNEKLEDLIDQKVAQKLAESQLSQAVAERDSLITKMARDLQEAKIALKNRPTDSPTAGGTNEDKPEVQTNFFTKEQLAELKARGVDPQKVIENYRKIKEI